MSTDRKPDNTGQLTISVAVPHVVRWLPGVTLGIGPGKVNVVSVDLVVIDHLLRTLDALGRIVLAPDGRFGGLGTNFVGGGNGVLADDLASERLHVHVGSPAPKRYPSPRTYAAVNTARRQEGDGVVDQATPRRAAEPKVSIWLRRKRQIGYPLVCYTDDGKVDI